ncbi:S41 family peptidase [Fibrella aquatica]|uniref:S41 family peptidase n=1 Tax=Fibrella aquatica TaxID=3242487 RepID=UPI00351FA47F
MALFVVGTLLLTGCKKDPVEVSPTGVTTADAAVNDWILENMRYAYYWNDKIPASPNKALAPDAFFNGLLYKYNATSNPQGDRFSWIQESAAELTATLNGETTTTGLDFTLLLAAQGSTDVVGVVTYVIAGSPADKAGMKRNDIFYSVNGISLTTDQAVLNRAFADESVTQTYGIATIQNGAIAKTSKTVAVTPVVLQENPIFKDSVYTDGSRKIAYLMYNQFVPGPNGSSTASYDTQINTIFGKFKAQGVNELILDLRYNGGGASTSSTNLASLIVKELNGQSNLVFHRREYNASLTQEIRASEGDNFFNTYFQPKTNNIGNQLSRVYVVTTRRTASASELVINGLRPYMTVNTIGTTSYGKNVGSITITDDENKSNKWGMQPIVFRTFNKNNESDYWAGFTPTVEVNEPFGALVPLGDLRDPLLATAINHMKGLTTGGRRASTPDLTIGSSDDFKPGANTLYTASPFVKLK